jgi:hypothetical protein
MQTNANYDGDANGQEIPGIVLKSLEEKLGHNWGGIIPGFAGGSAIAVFFFTIQ